MSYLNCSSEATLTVAMNSPMYTLLLLWTVLVYPIEAYSMKHG